MHKASGRWQLGLGLSLITAILWGILPLALGILLRQVSAATCMTVRFLVATIFLGTVLGIRKEWPKWQGLPRRTWALLAVAIAGLAGNYIFFQLGLSLTTPATAQLLIQISPVMFLLASVWIFKEHLGRVQVVGLLVLLVGFGLYFVGRGSSEEAGPSYAVGILYILIASVTWASYALAQKQLLTVFKSQPLMMMIYAGGFVMGAPFTSTASIGALDGLGVAILAFAAFNTIVAYGAFAEALAHWEASRVSAVLALTPILTIVLGAFLSHIWPDYVHAEDLQPINMAGAGIVVVGSMMTALGRH